MTATTPIKVASASMNQTVVNFTRNVPNILKAIDAAIEDGADVLSLQELGLTGYSGDDYFKWIRTDQQQQEIIELVQTIADYAAKKDPNLIISVGFPLFYADKTQDVRINIGTEDHQVIVDNPLYNINNRPFNAQALVSNGKIQSISAKSIQPDGAAEYEPRQFTNWPDYMGATEITLCNGQTVPFGNVVNQIGGEKNAFTLYHEICAEGWRGIYDDGTVNEKELKEGRELVHVANDHRVSLTLNPSASKPEPFLDKPALRATLCKTGSEITGGAYVYTNTGGVEAAPAAFEFGSIFANGGEISHRGERYSMADVVYSSQVMEVPIAVDPKAHATISHVPTANNNRAAHLTQGGSAEWEKLDGDARQYEEITRSTTLWLRDYLKKTGQQGYFISLSGGQDSAFGAVMVSQMIDLNLHQLEEALDDKEKAVDAFIDQFDGQLEYGYEIKAVNAANGADAAIKELKAKMLTCAYLPSENSSKYTEDAARFLIEGGTSVTVLNDKGEQQTLLFDPAKDRMEDGKLMKWRGKKEDGTDNIIPFSIIEIHENQEGIGGTFHIVPMQHVIDSYMQAFAGYDEATTDAPEALKKTIAHEIKDYVKGGIHTFSNEVAKYLPRHDNDGRGWKLPSWETDKEKNPNSKNDDLTLQNIQARARAPMAWLFGNDERKIACVTSNWSEAVAGYWTFGGDGHMGSINICGGVPKSDLREALTYLQRNGLHGLKPVEGLAVVNGNKASAELRPLVNGQIVQSDEDDMMPYEQLDAIARKIIIEKHDPLTAYQQLKDNDLFRTNEELIGCIEECCWRWHANQFKRVAAVIAPFLGENVDPHTAVRTTIISDGFRTGRAMLKLEYAKEQLGGEQAFEEHAGIPYTQAKVDVRINRSFRDAILNEPDLAKLKEDLPAYVQSAANYSQQTWIKGAA